MVINENTEGYGFQFEEIILFFNSLNHNLMSLSFLFQKKGTDFFPLKEEK